MHPHSSPPQTRYAARIAIAPSHSCLRICSNFSHQKRSTSRPWASQLNTLPPISKLSKRRTKIKSPPTTKPNLNIVTMLITMTRPNSHSMHLKHRRPRSFNFANVNPPKFSSSCNPQTPQAPPAKNRPTSSSATSPPHPATPLSPPRATRASSSTATSRPPRSATPARKQFASASTISS